MVTKKKIAKKTIKKVKSNKKEIIEKEFSPVNNFSHIYKNYSPLERLEETRKAAKSFREEILKSPKVVYYKSFNLIRVPYPVKYGFLNAANVMSPFLHILNRLFIIQFNQNGKIKTLLFSPSDVDANEETPFFKRLNDPFGPLKNLGKKFLAPIIRRVEDALALTGIMPDQVDYISYDHLHTQDLRKWLGSNGSRGYFPNAKLLVMKEEWLAIKGLIPTQADWYCPNGSGGVESSRVEILEESIKLGDGVYLLRTPGHTMGNHSLVTNTDGGIFVTSENGISADNYSPIHSKIPGVRKYARKTGSEVVLNGNTLESGLEQYISMVLEKEVAGPNDKNPNFFNVVNSSELTSYWGFPGIEPSFYFGEMEFGKPVIH
ncbi:MAG: hypothetical protein KDK36_06105 [Leptospiraceae bacterium]|nr:hypothetical protein [Leptospiraceae bacterium]